MYQDEVQRVAGPVTNVQDLDKLCESIARFEWFSVAGNMELPGRIERETGSACLMYLVETDGYEEHIRTPFTDVDGTGLNTPITSYPPIRKVVFAKKTLNEEAIIVGPLLREFVCTCEAGFSGSLQLLRFFSTADSENLLHRLVLSWEVDAGNCVLYRASIRPEQEILQTRDDPSQRSGEMEGHTKRWKIDVPFLQRRFILPWSK